MAAVPKLAYYGINPITQRHCAYVLDDVGREIMVGQAKKKGLLLARLREGTLKKAREHCVVNIVEPREYKALNGQPSKGDVSAFNVARRENPEVFAPINDEPPVPTRVKFTYQEKFHYYGVYADMVLSRNSRAMVVPGPPGIGKSFLLKQFLKKHKLVNCRDFTEKAKEEGRHLSTYGDYIIFEGGRMTARAFYRILWEFRKNIIVLDDCYLLEDEDAANIAKGALHNDGPARVCWVTNKSGEAKDGDLPESFEFEGKVICLTNMKASQLDSAVRNRCWIANLWIDVEETFALMRDVLEGPNQFQGQYTKREINETLDWMYDNRGICSEVSFRSFKQAVELRHVLADRDWKRAVLHAIQTPE